jgi:uncharacterized protein (TIGR00299 family) protein
MGAAGDMLTAALLELLDDPDGFLAEVNALGIPGVALRRERAVKCGITGTHVRVTVDGAEEEAHDHDHAHEHHHHAHDHAHHHHDHEHEHEHDHAHDHDHGHEHHHSRMQDITALLDALPVSARVRRDAAAVYALIADAESRAHGVPVTEIHFHEVGTMDAVADIVAVCMLMERLAPERVVVSPVHVGSGHVHCAHGVLPVPAPATADILRDVPIYSGDIRGELCTPTGAALLKHFADSFGAMPVLRTERIGYGMGQKDFPAANCVRALLGTEGEAAETVAELVCNLDDMTAEAVGFAAERLLAAGALDVFTLPAGMKKGRPGTLLCVLCRPEDRDALLPLLFRHTSTLGVRERLCRRYALDRREETQETALGTVRKKISAGYGVTREKYEYEDLARIAREQGISLEEARGALRGPAR